jgi:hypothetical protein
MINKIKNYSSLRRNCSFIGLLYTLWKKNWAFQVSLICIGQYLILKVIKWNCKDLLYKSVLPINLNGLFSNEHNSTRSYLTILIRSIYIHMHVKHKYIKHTCTHITHICTHKHTNDNEKIYADIIEILFQVLIFLLAI